jgi:hypothetical protein
MLNELQVKMLDKGWWPNRAWMSIHGQWDVKNLYPNRKQRRDAARAGKRKKINLNVNRVQIVTNRETGLVKRIIHAIKRII